MENDKRSTKEKYDEAKKIVDEINKSGVINADNAEIYLSALQEMYLNYTKPNKKGSELGIERRQYGGFSVSKTGTDVTGSMELNEQGDFDAFGLNAFGFISLEKITNQEAIIYLAKHILQNYELYDPEKATSKVLLEKNLIAPKTSDEKKNLVRSTSSVKDYVEKAFVEPRDIQLMKLALKDDNVAKLMSIKSYVMDSIGGLNSTALQDTSAFKEQLKKEIQDWEKVQKPKILDKIKDEYDQIKKELKQQSKENKSSNSKNNPRKHEEPEVKSSLGVDMVKTTKIGGSTFYEQKEDFLGGYGSEKQVKPVKKKNSTFPSRKLLLQSIEELLFRSKGKDK